MRLPTGLDDQVVHAPVDLERGVEQARVGVPAAVEALEHGRGALLEMGDDALRRLHRETPHRGELEDRAELERLVDERDADVGDLDAPLRNEAHEALGLEPLERLARGTQRHVEQRAQFALRDELAGRQVALEELALKRS